jgi:Tfp pilus assembly protein PilN
MFTGQWVACDATVTAGDSYAGGVFSRPAAPTPPRQPITKIEYLRRFTQAERVAIRVAAESNHIVNDYVELLNATATLHLDDPDVIAGVNQLEQAGLLVAGRAAEILA